jgi:hypothetical protein
MSNEDIDARPRREELQGALRCAVDAVRSTPPPPEAEQQTTGRLSHWADAMASPSPRPAAGRAGRWLRGGRRILWPTAACVAGLILCFLLMPGNGKSGNLLAEVFQAFDRAPAYHFALRRLGSSGQAVPQRTTEIWVVRGIGRREEVRIGEKLTVVTTDNLRWLLRRDVDDGLVIAAPSRMAEPRKYCEIEDSECLMSRDKCLHWAEQRKATIQIESDRLDGRPVEKVVVFWPGGEVDDREIVWYDPVTRRPVKFYVYSKSFEHDYVSEYEISIDYPAPEAIPADRLALHVPPEDRLEIEDSQLGRRIVSQGRKGVWPAP